MRQGVEKGLQLFFRPAVAPGDFRITQNPADLCENRFRHDQVKLCSTPSGENLRWRATRTEDRAHQHVGIQHDAHHTLRRLALVRTARMASRTSASITSGLTLRLCCCTSSTAAKNCSRRLCHSSSCHKGTTAAMGLPARSITY